MWTFCEGSHLMAYSRVCPDWVFRLPRRGLHLESRAVKRNDGFTPDADLVEYNPIHAARISADVSHRFHF